jgi:hypothetical protein
MELLPEISSQITVFELSNIYKVENKVEVR